MPENRSQTRWGDRVGVEEILTQARSVIDTEMEGIRQVRDDLGGPFADLVYLCLDVLDRKGKIVLTGVGKSGHIGQKLAATLSSTGSRAVFMHPVEAMHGDLGLLAQEDVLVALSYSGETDELLAVLPAAKRLGATIVAITGETDSRLANWAELTVPMTVPREACPFNMAPTTSTTALLALGDALALVLLDCRQFELTDYARFHPAGAIGRSITLRVTDIMRSGDLFAKVGPETLVRDTLFVMTRVRCGAVAVVNDAGILLGIFTDGDFRRHIIEDPAVLDVPVESVMTPDPITIRDDAMAVELVKLLETRKIDDILVVDAENRALGLVDLQDLPRFKIL
ncbi:MAG: KpsF/GutQ family sugar-phosphate isomerase [Lentisphaeria bacterium]|nr:KpsF/GutQ family sugar-phosphate isomerase [Lentisphaeria bacterium]